MYLTLSSSMSAFSNLRFRICGSVEKALSWAARLERMRLGIESPHHHHYHCHHVPMSHLVRVMFLQQGLELLQRHIDARPSLLLHQWLGDLCRAAVRAALSPSAPISLGRAPTPCPQDPRPCGSCRKRDHQNSPGSRARCPCCRICALGRWCCLFIKGPSFTCQ